MESNERVGVTERQPRSYEERVAVAAKCSKALDLGFPMLVGVSRKRFLGTLLADADGEPRPARDRDDASVALTTLLAAEGIWGVRTHTVRGHRDAIDVVRRWQRPVGGVRALG